MLASAAWPQGLGLATSFDFNYEMGMKMRTRKLIGTIASVIYLAIYCLLAMVLGGRLVVGYGIAAELPFYIIAGLGWLPLEMMIIKWMSKPDAI